MRAITSAYAKLCKMKKLIDFTHSEQKNTHISGCKIMHIYTVTVACAFGILIISDSLLFFSLSSSSAKLTLPLMFFLPLIPHTPTDTKSKINHKNKKSTTKSTKKKSTTRTKSLDRCWWKSMMVWCGSVLMEIGDGLTEISVDRDRCWWSACDGLTEKRKEKDSQKKKKKKRRRKRGGDRDKDGVKKGLFRGKRRVRWG